MQAPGVRLGAWPALVSAGAVVGLAVQAVLSQRVDLPVARVLLLTLVACGLGVFGGKGYYLALHRDRQDRNLMATGMAVQGFVLVLIATLSLGGPVAGLPLGPLADVTVPGLLFGMAIGRLGCFLGGCCAGRPTAGGFGVWSSDRHAGLRRVPTQFLESAVAGAAGVVSLLIQLHGEPTPHGALFVGGLSAYTIGRQLIFPYRDLPRKTARGRLVVLALAVVGAAGAVMASLLA
ncbi:MAG: prolipoprotein diacylglyceryl transferase [Actinobacteria bacterium]|nr:prolipoprotein diacylglyceryl transferase [Actinomycetota bacterium]